VEVINSAPAVVPGIIARQAADLRNPPRTVDDVLEMLQIVGLSRNVARVRKLYWASLSRLADPRSCQKSFKFGRVTRGRARAGTV